MRRRPDILVAVRRRHGHTTVLFLSEHFSSFARERHRHVGFDSVRIQ